MTPSKPNKPSGIESLPVEVIDQIISYHAGSRAFLKNLRLVRPFPQDNPDKLEEICKTPFVNYVETLHLKLDLSVYLFSKSQWDETTAQAAMDCIERCLKLFPRLKQLAVTCPPHWGGYYSSTAARPDILQSVMTAFTLSPPPTLTELDVRFPERLKLTQPAGNDDDANPNRGIAPWVANLHSISLIFDQQYEHKDDAVCELLQYGANLETVRLRRYTRLYNTPRLLIHHKAPLKCLTLEGVTISGESLAYTIASFKRTVTHMVLDDVNLSDGRWEDVLLELSTCQNLVVLDLSRSMGYARGDQNYEAMLALFKRCRVIQDRARARKIARSHD